MKNIIIASILAIAVLFAAFIVTSAVVAASKNAAIFELYNFDGALYRLNEVNGRIDVLIPSAEGALLFPVGQVQITGADGKFTEEEKVRWGQNLKTVSQYIQIERARTLGLVPDAKEE